MPLRLGVGPSRYGVGVTVETDRTQAMAVAHTLAAYSFDERALRNQAAWSAVNPGQPADSLSDFLRGCRMARAMLHDANQRDAWAARDEILARWAPSER